AQHDKALSHRRPAGTDFIPPEYAHPIFDPQFSESGFGFRVGRSAHDAVYQVRDYIRRGCRFAVDADLSKFFDFHRFWPTFKGASIRWSDKAFKRVKQRLKELTGQNPGHPVGDDQQMAFG
ncbi:MAG: hypothetical protein R6U28_09340, partial [Cyclonatronaceae bacterium]